MSALLRPSPVLISDIAGTVLLALERLRKHMDRIATLHGMGPVKHDVDCEMGDICSRCLCPRNDRCECTCGKLQGFNG